MGIPDTVGGRVRELRKTRGWTQQRLAVAARVGYSTIEDLESTRRQRLPRVDTLIRVADALGVGVCSLLGYPCERDGNALARMEVARIRDRLADIEGRLVSPKEPSG